MALFGRKKKEDIKAAEGEPRQRREQPKEKEPEKQEARVGLPQGKDPKLYKIIEKPIVTEKGVDLASGGAYVFKVSRRANKVEVKKAIEKLYEVKVKKIRMINVIGKYRQVGRFEGWKPGFRKAIVSLEKGYKIEVA